MLIYTYSRTTGEYIGTAMADPDPMLRNRLTGEPLTKQTTFTPSYIDTLNDDVNAADLPDEPTEPEQPKLTDSEGWLIPARATTLPPPEIKEHEAAVFSDGAWQIKADYRDCVYWLADGSRHVITKLGDQKPDNALDVEPKAPAAQRRTATKSRIDATAGTTRSRFITTVPGQEGTYQLKADEAAAYIAAGYPEDTSQYPMLSAESAARSIAFNTLADEVAATRKAWIQCAATIEALRMSGKGAVDSAADDADFDVIAQPYIDQLDGMVP